MSLPSFTKTWHNDVYDAINPTRPELSTKGYLVVITGGGSGIGPKIAEAFAQAGAANIAILGRTEKTLKSTKSFIESKYTSKVSTFVTDISDAGSVNQAFRSIATLGFINVLINNAGYLPNIGTIRDSDADEWLQGHEVNLKGSFLVTRAFLRGAASDAVLINVSSAIAHVSAVPGHSAYSVSKLAATKLFEYVQQENPELRVINFHPGVIETNMANKAKAQSGIVWPLDTVELPAQTLVWLVSSEAAFLKGVGKFIWTNWDVEELKAAATKITEPTYLMTGLNGWPANLSD